MVDFFVPLPCASRRDLQPCARRSAPLGARARTTTPAPRATMPDTACGSRSWPQIAAHLPARTGDVHGQHDQRQATTTTRATASAPTAPDTALCVPPSRRPTRSARPSSINVPPGTYTADAGRLRHDRRSRIPPGVQIIGTGRRRDHHQRRRRQTTLDDGPRRRRQRGAFLALINVTITGSAVAASTSIDDNDIVTATDVTFVGNNSITGNGGARLRTTASSGPPARRSPATRRPVQGGAIYNDFGSIASPVTRSPATTRRPASGRCHLQQRRTRRHGQLAPSPRTRAATADEADGGARSTPATRRS